MNRSDRLTQIITEYLGVRHEDVKLDSSLVDDLGADSLDSIEIIMSLEEEFGIEISDADAEGVNTVADLEALLNKLGVPAA